MTAQKCVVEGCNLEYDVVCSFSFYNVNTGSEDDGLRQEWIDGAMQEESECMWRHVSLHLCGYHFELDSQGLWIDSPMLPDLLTLQEPAGPKASVQDQRAADMIKVEHNYSAEAPARAEPNVSRLNVRQLVDTLGYLSLKNLQRKQLWVVKVETDAAEASISQAEQVIHKMQDPKQIIEVPQQSSSLETPEPQTEVLQIMDDATISDNFIYEIAEEQEITMEEVKEIPSEPKEWMVNIVPDESKPKYAYIKHCSTGKKKRHFTAEMNEITLQGDFENYYILPDADPSVGVEITTSYEPENYIVEEYPHLVLEERPRKRSSKEFDPNKKKKKKIAAAQREAKKEVGEDWIIQNNIVYEAEQDASDDYDDKKGNARVRRKNRKYLGYDFVT